MEPFLKIVARDLARRYTHRDMSRIALVFPSKRAGIFMNEYLFDAFGQQTFWAPQYLTINELMDQFSPLKKEDDIRTVCLLYDIFCRHTADIFVSQDNRLHPAMTGSNISLDYFFGWGCELISDFSNLDNHLVDAEAFFRHLDNAKEIEALGEETQARLRSVFKKDQSQIRQLFNQLWERLYGIYQDLNTTLAERGTGYSGARARRAVELLSEKNVSELLPDTDAYVFIGFNQLLTAEHALFRLLKEQDKALFYWDYDTIYIGQDRCFSVGNSMENNLKDFPNQLTDPQLFNNFRDGKTLEIVCTASDTGQARFATEWIRKNLTEEERRTAIVLCDENLLQPLLHSIPTHDDGKGGRIVKEVNITKGFPMIQSPAFVLMNKECTACPDLDNVELLRHLAEVIKTKAAALKGPENWMNQLSAESFFQCYRLLNRLLALVEEGVLKVGRRVLLRLLMQIAQQQTIPFHGEPATGLQIMGVLETRTLDFDHVLLLSVNEGVVPHKPTDNSFFPYDLRKAYGLMTNDEQSEVYAYNFFRLLQRASHVTMVYNGAVNSDNKGEMSRFLLQLKWQAGVEVSERTLEENQSLPKLETSEVKAEEVTERMASLRSLSPSAIENYMQCPMKFYYANLLGLRRNQLPTDILQPNTLGSIFHETAHEIYSSLIDEERRDEFGYPIDVERLKHISEVEIEDFLRKSFHAVSIDDELDYPEKSVPEKRQTIEEKIQNGEITERYLPEDHLIEFSVLKKYLGWLLKADARLQNLHVVEMERYQSIEMEGKRIGGFIDRLDSISLKGKQVIRVADYKTGTYDKRKTEFNSIEELFDEGKMTNHYVFQTLLYSLVCQEQLNPGHLDIVPALIYPQKLGNEDYQPYLTKAKEKGMTMTDNDCADFKERLARYIQQMAQTDIRPTNNLQNCRFCDFRLLCGR